MKNLNREALAAKYGFPVLIEVSEAAVLLGTSVSQIHMLINKNILHAKEVETDAPHKRMLRIDVEELKKLLKPANPLEK